MAASATMQAEPKTFLRSCKNCVKVRVCVLYRSVAKMLEASFTDGTKPFEAEDLSAICRENLSDDDGA